MLKLFYITNNPDIAKIAEDSGVDRIFVDMEYIGKELRQGGMDTVKNRHTIEDVKNIRKAIKKSELLVRINPINSNSKVEIDKTIDAGADIIMLPMWKSVDEVEKFLTYVDSRAKTMLLLETSEAEKCIDDVLETDGIDEIHIGLNDLSLTKNKKFMFELLVDGTVDRLTDKFNSKGITFGFGGFGRVYQNALLPAQNIIAEHYRLNSSMAILSRSFCNSLKTTDLETIKSTFQNGIKDNRNYEKELLTKGKEFFEQKHKETERIIKKIVG